MESKDLRVGNLVAYKDDRISVTQILPLWIESDYSPYGYIEYDKITGIPLTEGWLLKFGFTLHKTYDSISYYYFNDIVLILEDDVIKFAHPDHSFDYLTFNDKPIRFVHQLQNLYFALTGEELTIKQTA